uniref:Uncharacterized protein n=1 Tax=Caenorhabditis japonica TaxID=281687 RepID=A0A8R1IW13_CAEJA
MDQGDYANVILVIAILLASFDVALYWALTPLEHHINCGTIGCFVSDQFRYYWGISNMILGLMAVFLSCSIFWKIRTVQSKSSVTVMQRVINGFIFIASNWDQCHLRPLKNHKVSIVASAVSAFR